MFLNVIEKTKELLNTCALCEHRRDESCRVCSVNSANDPWWPEVKEVKRINVASGEDSLCLN